MTEQSESRPSDRSAFLEAEVERLEAVNQKLWGETTRLFGVLLAHERAAPETLLPEPRRPYKEALALVDAGKEERKRLRLALTLADRYLDGCSAARGLGNEEDAARLLGQAREAIAEALEGS